MLPTMGDGAGPKCTYAHTIDRQQPNKLCTANLLGDMHALVSVYCALFDAKGWDQALSVLSFSLGSF